MSIVDVVLAHKVFALTVTSLTISEVLPFISSTKWNGILQGILALVKSRLASAVVVLACMLTVAGCAAVKADLKIYGLAFATCMEKKGLSAAPGLASEVFQILDAGKGDVTGQLNGFFEGLGTEAAKDAFDCAVSSWMAANPVKADMKPTKSQAAARVMQARLMKLGK